jgi:hypothetical protein
MSEHSMSSLPAMTGWLWLKNGLALFRRQPAALLAVLFLDFFLSGALTSIPLAGPYIAFVLMPCFAIALMQAAALIDQGERVSLNVLLTGFTRARFPRLAGIGLVYGAVALLLVIFASTMVDETALRAMFEALDHGKEPSDVSPLLPLMLVSALNLLILVALAFAGPLVTWQDMGVGKAVFYSVVGTMRAAKVFFVLLLTWLFSMFAASMLAGLVFGLLGAFAARVAVMWLVCVFLLVLQCALYCGYRQIFGLPDLGHSRAGGNP